ncbi:MAG: serine/threonine protein kinase [Deltaproteobacteria bacterium]|nr:serine/threonine protein kinase [Deltaproteobacteria bacterium]
MPRVPDRPSFGALPFAAAAAERGELTTLARPSDRPVRVDVQPPDEVLDEIGDVAPERYSLRATLGEGGMGEVLLCRDRVIGREVALKVARRSRTDQAELRARFLREVCVQGQLEHPAIVPVYDLAKDATGRWFFTMKRVRGLTLATVIGHLAAGERSIVAEHTRHKLLAAFGRVCLAIDFAHSRGVVHRDLKPANIMLGDFGEVYVLDWGVAKVEAAPSDERADGPDALDPSGERRALPMTTEEGIVLGTPAYMAPEQERGDPVDARTDVYALGAILFEMLTHRGLWECRRRRGVDLTRAAEWTSDVPAELSRIWRRATSEDPAARHASARELHDEIERYLSGELDAPSKKAAHEHESHAEREASLRRAALVYTLPPLVFLLPTVVVMGVKSGWAAFLVVASFLVSGAIAAASSGGAARGRVPWIPIVSSLAIAISAIVTRTYVLLPTCVFLAFAARYLGAVRDAMIRCSPGACCTHGTGDHRR